LGGWKALDWEYCALGWGDPALLDPARRGKAWSPLGDVKRVASPGAKRREWTRECAKIHPGKTQKVSGTGSSLLHQTARQLEKRLTEARDEGGEDEIRSIEKALQTRRQLESAENDVRRCPQPQPHRAL